MTSIRENSRPTMAIGFGNFLRVSPGNYETDKTQLSLSCWASEWCPLFKTGIWVINYILNFYTCSFLFSLRGVGWLQHFNICSVCPSFKMFAHSKQSEWSLRISALVSCVTPVLERPQRLSTNFSFRLDSLNWCEILYFTHSSLFRISLPVTLLCLVT